MTQLIVQVQEKLDSTRELELRQSSKESVEDAYKEIIDLRQSNEADDREGDVTKVQEQAVYALGEFYVKQREAEKLHALFMYITPFCDLLPKVRTAKIVRTMIDLMSKIKGTDELQVRLCEDCISWAETESRTFLRHRVETRLAYL
eukprot:GHVN01020204.1.p1 GENE.GHVN01020204.1~~GHVN01020204.1.p1  ORF type:complete len:146 (+),score=13.27 GHVN01020204.1:41-478(+)